jgi:hypothetical protein
MSTACDRQQQRAAKRANKPPSGKQIEELADRAEASGCDRCGTRFAELLPYFICRTTAYAFSVRCDLLQTERRAGLRWHILRRWRSVER